MKRTTNKLPPPEVGGDRDGGVNPLACGLAPSGRVPVVVNGGGWVYVGGVKVARCVRRGGEVVLRFVDKDRRRSSERGTRFVHAAIEDLAEALGAGPVVVDTED